MNELAVKTKDAFSAISKNHPFGVNLDDRTLQFWSDAVNLPFDAVLNTTLTGRVFRT
jgi:hypothetical protein